MTAYTDLDPRSDMDARVAADYALARRLLEGFGLRMGDRLVIEEVTRTERRLFVGEVIFAYVTRDGGVRVTYTGKSRWAAGSGSAALVGGDRAHPTYGTRVLRRVTPSDARALRAAWSAERSAINAREVTAA